MDSFQLPNFSCAPTFHICFCENDFYASLFSFTFGVINNWEEGKIKKNKKLKKNNWEEGNVKAQRAHWGLLNHSQRS